MNCFKEAEYKLRDYSAKCSAILSTEEQIALLEQESVGVRAATTDGTAVRGGGNRREDALLHNIALRSELQTAHDRAAAWVRVVDRALGVLSPEERLVLDRFYINRQKGSAERLMDELCVEKSQVYRRKDAALRHFTVALYGGVET